MLVVGGVWGAVIILIYGDISPVNIDTCLHIFRSGGRPSAIIVKYLAGPGHRRLPADCRAGNEPSIFDKFEVLQSRRRPLLDFKPREGFFLCLALLSTWSMLDSRM